jgi:hypothetical protein
MIPISAVCAVITSSANTLASTSWPARGTAKVLHHLQGAFVVLDHQGQERAVKGDPRAR